MLFGQLRAAQKMGLAAGLIQQLLEVESVCGTFKGDTKEGANRIVLAFWAKIPELREVQELPRAATLAAAAMAQGIKDLDSVGNKREADMLFRCHGSFMQHVFPSLVMEPQRLRGVDRKLLDIAYAAFSRD